MRALRSAAVLAAAVPVVLAAQRRPHFHRLAATPHTVAWGYYSAAAAPVLRIASGDTVEVETLITSTPQALERAGLPSGEVQRSLRAIVDSVTDHGPGGHILTGPIYVEGAEPGDVLEVHIADIGFAIPYGYNGCHGFLPENCGPPHPVQIIPLDTLRRVARLEDGITIPLHPFFGSIGDAPPPDSGRLSSNPPGTHAGNLDDKELVAGTTLYIPVHAPGALLEVGDGHAAQGDGEVDQTAIETSLVGRLVIRVRKDLHYTWPHAETATSLMTMGMDRDLTQATRIAVQQMVELLMTTRHLPRDRAYALASMAADLHIGELVDGNVCVYMTVPKGIAGE